MKTSIILGIIAVIVISLGVISLRSQSQLTKNDTTVTTSPIEEIEMPKKTEEPSTQESIKKILTEKYNRPEDAVMVEMSFDDGQFAKGSFNEIGMGGGLWFAAKTANGWELAFDGNGIVPCDAANAYNFPASIIPTCIDTQHDNALIER